jgi:predicted MFS family arabinose efflux permease
MLQQYLTLPRAIHVLCAGALINRAGSFLLPFLTLYLTTRLKLGTEFATLAMGIHGAGAIVALLAGGHLADMLGRRTVMLISLVGAASVLLIFGALRAPWLILTAVLVFSFLAEMYRPAASAMIADLAPPERRPHAFGLMHVAVNLGFAVAASLGGVLARYSFQWLFLGDALTALACALIIFLTISETLPGRARHRHTPDGPSTPADRTTLGEALRHILTDWTFLSYWFGSFLLAAMFMQALSTLPLYMGNLGMGSETYGGVIALNGLLIVVLMIPMTSLITRYHRGNMIALSAVVMACGFGLTGVATTPWHFAGTVVVWTVGEMMNAPLMLAVIGDISPPHLRGRYMGVYAMCFSVAVMIGAPLGGLVLEHKGGAYVWGGSAAAGTMAAAVFWLVRKRGRVSFREKTPDPF